jgi:hypothetical protein
VDSQLRRFPEHVEVLVREPQRHGQPGRLQHIQGEQHHLEQRAIAAGTVRLSDVIARWWVLDEDHRSRRREPGIWPSTGHDAVCGEELYDIVPETRGGYGRLQDFGIRFGYERVILHLEPRVKVGRVESNTARTLLLLDHEPAPMGALGRGVRRGHA